MEFVDELRQLKEQLKFKERIDAPKKFDNIVIAGMGGSGISGKIFQEIYTRKPVSLVDDYNVPAFISKSTLFIGISYSGSTEETIAATRTAIKNGAYAITISSGGELADHGDQHIRIPRNDLQPRSATGYMLMPFIRGFELATDSEIKEAQSLLSDLDKNDSDAERHAKSIAKSDSIPVIYGASPFRSVAYRWKTQFNENSKIMAYSSSFPELNHNDTMAIAQTYRKKDFYFLVFDSDDKMIKKRIDVTKKITDSQFNMIIPKGKSTVAKLFYLIHYGDYLTYRLGLLRGVDPTDVSLIQKLKKLITDQRIT